MMRANLALALILAFPAFAGCLNEEPMGMFRLQVKDAPADVSFESLTTSVERIVLTMKDGMRMDVKVENVTLDLASLGGVALTVFDGGMMAGDYKRLDIYLGEGRGVLRDGGVATVVAPNGRVYVDKEFTVPNGGMAEFVFDLGVKDSGDSGYHFVGSVGSSESPSGMDME